MARGVGFLNTEVQIRKYSISKYSQKCMYGNLPSAGSQKIRCIAMGYRRE